MLEEPTIKVGLLDERGSIFCQKRLATQPELGPEAVIGNIAEVVRAVLSERGMKPDQMNSIGIGVPGTTDADTGVVIYAPNIFWRDVPVGPMLHSMFGVPVYATQDTRAAAWAEYLVGKTQGLGSVACITLGTGIGCGLVFDGKIFHGAMNTAGEFGHQLVEIDGNSCNCGRKGCIETYAGGLAIVRLAKERIPNLWELLGKDTVAVDDVYRLSEQGNPQARKLTDEVVKYIGIGMVNLINLTSVEMICISGGISNAPDALLLDPLVAFVRSRAYQTVADRVQIRRSALGDNAPLIGASLLFRTRL